MLREITVNSGHQREAVLIVDREIDMSSTFVNRLLMDGFCVCIAQNVAAARKHFEKNKFSFAVTELSFDDGDGIEVIEALLDREESCRIIVHSKFCTLGNAVHSIKAGARDVLPKPTADDLLLAILLDRSLRTPEFSISLTNPELVRNKYIKETLGSCNSSVGRAARKLSMNRRTLQRIVKRMPALNE